MKMLIVRNLAYMKLLIMWNSQLPSIICPTASILQSVMTTTALMNQSHTMISQCTMTYQQKISVWLIRGMIRLASKLIGCKIVYHSLYIIV
jgi:hypothetical protein